MSSDNETAEAERRYADAPRRRAFEDGARWALKPECGVREEWGRAGGSKGWHACTLKAGHEGNHYCESDFKSWGSDQ